RLAAAGQKCGDQNTVISLMDRGRYGAKLEQANCTVHCLQMPRGRITLRGLLTLYSIIKSARPDVVQTWMYHADLIGGITARLAGVKAVVWGIRHANFDRDKNAGSTPRIIKLCAWLSSTIPARIVCCSVNAAPLHKKIGYRANKIIVIPNGYELGELQPCPESGRRIREEFKLDENAPLIGMVARFDPQKDHQNLIEALMLLRRQHRVFTCLLVGCDMTPGNDHLMRRLQQAGVEKNVFLLGPRNDIPAIMNALDVHVLSSLGEAFPNVLAEAMACATPCVTTNVGDASLIVGNTGWVVPARNAQSLSNAIALALDERRLQPLTWQRRRDDCRQRIVQNFSLKKMLASYHAVWADTAKCNRPFSSAPACGPSKFK
ncbi:MAG TPA: glycosyltransferase, partial [Paralcaligenes sp.]